MKTVTLNVPDISCEHCERAITGALSPVEGVESVKVYIAEKQVQVAYDDKVVDVEKMKEVLAEEEYPVASVTGA